MRKTRAAASPHEGELVAKAVRNLQEGVTWVGFEEDAAGSVLKFQEVFPWLAELLAGGGDAGPPVEGGRSYVYAARPATNATCVSGAVNATTFRLIQEFNTRDLAVHRAAREWYKLQQEVIHEYHQALPLD